MILKDIMRKIKERNQFMTSITHKELYLSLIQKIVPVKNIKLLWVMLENTTFKEYDTLYIFFLGFKYVKS